MADCTNTAFFGQEPVSKSLHAPSSKEDTYQGIDLPTIDDNSQYI